MRENNRRALADSSEAIRLSPLDPQGYVLKMLVYMDMYPLLGVKVAPARVDEMVPDGPAAKSGFEVGDVIVGIDEQKIESFADVQRIVASHANCQITFQIIRGGATTELKATPDRREMSDRYGNKLQVGVIGIRRNPLAQEAEYKRYQPDESDMKDYDDAIADLTEAIRRNVDFSSIHEAPFEDASLAYPYAMRGLIYFQVKGHKEVAIADFRRAISMGPGPNTKQELQKMLQVLGLAP